MDEVDKILTKQEHGIEENEDQGLPPVNAPIDQDDTQCDDSDTVENAISGQGPPFQGHHLKQLRVSRFFKCFNILLSFNTQSATQDAWTKINVHQDIE